MKEISLKEINHRITLKVVAWVTIIFFGIGLYFTLFTLIEMEMLLHSPAFKELSHLSFDSEQNSKGTFGFSSIQSLTRLVYVALFFITLTGLIAGIGLLKRRNWGRILFSVMAGIATVIIVGGNIYFVLLLDRFLVSFSDDYLPTVQKIQFLSYELFLVLLAWMLVRMTVKINSPEMRLHFGKGLEW